jgi:hypothetical protein
MLSTLTPPSTSSDRRARWHRCAAHLGDLGSTLVDELLAAEARIHRHQQHQIELVERVVQPVERRGRIEHQPGLAAMLADELDGAIHVLGRLGMKADVVAPAPRNPARAIHRRTIRCTSIGALTPCLAQRLAHHRPDGEIRHVVVVHDVEMDPIGAGGEHRVHLLARGARNRPTGSRGAILNARNRSWRRPQASRSCSTRKFAS